jgi:hypothetical protein
VTDKPVNIKKNDNALVEAYLWLNEMNSIENIICHQRASFTEVSILLQRLSREAHY